MALGKFLRGFFASAAANWVLSISDRSGNEAGTHGHDFCPNVRKGSLRYHTRPAEKTTFGATYTVKLDKRTGVLPIAKSDSIVVGASAKVKNDAEDDKANNSDNLDGPGRCKASENMQGMGRDLDVRKYKLGFAVYSCRGGLSLTTKRTR